MQGPQRFRTVRSNTGRSNRQCTVRINCHPYSRPSQPRAASAGAQQQHPPNAAEAEAEAGDNVADEAFFEANVHGLDNVEQSAAYTAADQPAGLHPAAATAAGSAAAAEAGPRSSGPLTLVARTVQPRKTRSAAANRAAAERNWSRLQDPGPWIASLGDRIAARTCIHSAFTGHILER